MHLLLLIAHFILLVRLISRTNEVAFWVSYCVYFYYFSYFR